MLNHSIIGQTADGYLVGYPTPGCSVPTVATICRTQEAAQREAERLNERQVPQEEEQRIVTDA